MSKSSKYKKQVANATQKAKQEKKASNIKKRDIKIPSISNKPNRDALEICALVYAMWTAIVTPLWLEDQYFNQTEAKGHAFYAGAVILLIGMLITLVYKRTIKPLIPRKDSTEICAVAFGVLAIISSLLSEYQEESLLGNTGWWVGGIPMLFFSLFVIFLSNTIKWDKMLCWATMITGCAIFFLDMLHSAGIDTFGLHKDMLEGEVFAYLGTIGNIDWHIAYFTLTMPIIAILFMRCKERAMTVVYGCYLFMACMGIVLTRTDGIYVGIGLCAFFLIPYVMKNAQRLRRFLLIVGFYGVSALIVQNLPIFVNVHIHGGVCAFLAKPIIAGAMVVAGFGGFALLYYGRKELSERFSRIATIVIEAGLACAVLFFIIQTIRTFNNEWGSGRGVIWIYTIKLFNQMSFGEKLIGLGPETLRMYNTEINEVFGGWVLTNHSDFLQLLVTNGLLGLAAWIAMWASIIVKQVKSKVIEDDAFIFFICLMAYLGQSTVFTMECLCWPMLIVVMGLFLRYYKERTELQDVENT